MKKGNAYTAACVITSSVLFYLAFPNAFCRYGFSPLGWLFAVPLLYALERKGLKARFALGILFGLVSYSLIVKWLFPVTACGAIAFIFALTIQPILFCLFYPSREKRPVHLICVPTLWVSCEYVRALLLNGFTWNLGYSQGYNMPVIQAASLFGSYGISYALMVVNYSLYRISKDGPKKIYYVVVIIVLFSLFGYGHFSLRSKEDNSWALRVSVIQGNIGQHKKWDDAFAKEIMEKHIMLTKEASTYKPDLIVWPETSLPGDYFSDEEIGKRIAGLIKELGIPILLGAPISEHGKFFNSALLIGQDGALRRTYRKLYLIPFSEYLPPDSPLSFLVDKFNFKIGIFNPGKKLGIFSLKKGLRPDEELRQGFGVVICSEDFFPELVAELVDEGAGFVINITNDALFGESAAPYLHAQASIMRAVENRVPVVRCANAGWSCFITRFGEVVDSVERSGEHLFVDGHATSTVKSGTVNTLYSKWRDLFARCCLIVCGIFLLLGRMKLYI